MSSFLFRYLPEDGTNLIIEALTTVAHVEDLQSFFDCDAALEGLVVHQELHEVEKLARLEPSLIRNATLVHGQEFLLAHITVQIIINFLSEHH